MHISALTCFVLLTSFLAFTTLALPVLPTQEQPQKDNSGSFKIDVFRKESRNITWVHSGGVQWSTQVSIGSQTYTLLLDTGSSDFWVISTDTPASEQGKHNLYDPAASPTSKALPGETFNINYSVEGASGHVVTDKVNIGGAVVDQLAIGVATKVSKYLQERKEDGILGLAFKHGNSITPNQQPTFMESVQNSLAMPVMACNFRTKSQGTLEFGAIDRTAYIGELTTVPVNNRTDGSWTVDNVTFPAGDHTITQGMLFDTGAVWMTVQMPVAAAYWAQVPGAIDNNYGRGKLSSDWYFPCNATLPDYTFEAGGEKHTISGSYFDGDKFAHSPHDLCTGAFQGSHGRGSMGTAFFASHYVVFNQAEPSISFAPHA